MFIFKKLSIVLYNVHLYMHMIMFILKKLSFCAAVAANRCYLSSHGCRSQWSSGSIPDCSGMV